MQNKEELSLYIHIPFCVRKCGYCDFLSAPADENTRDRYVQALLMEIERYQGTETADRKIKTLYIGGGTPSILSVKQLECIMQKIKCTFNFNDSAEASMEMNPGTVTKEKCRALYQMGINRLSIGLQSTNDEELKALGRIHSYEDFLNTYTWCREAGFQNINVDLMAALPYQTVESYAAGLRKIVHLSPEHISAYSLILEEGTPFYQKYNSSCYPLPDEDRERLMYRETEQILAQAGYERYEISNYAKAGYACRHNLVYWQGGDYLGLGLGSSSYVDGARFHNTADFNTYVNQFINGEQPVDRNDEHMHEQGKQQIEGSAEDQDIQFRCRKYIEDWEELSMQAKMEEFMFLGLRVMEGVSGAEFENRFGKTMEEVYGAVLQKHEEEGFLRIERREDCKEDREETTAESSKRKTNIERVMLTTKGIDVSNYVFADFLL
ncbi:radical SAM family heme chaperone HemW [Kineothrix sp. MSJ-39]|uniref:radical SAM family heme chaperone HemW n=1 Tax=Kineothrix sp. MSJ-39 TaxID=2841533 RepID=UPI001C0FD9CF|nr:radical SAM family heme chaperone HemW [Kineothrix sp. MSJ-39]MBU5430195.1 radical SAM family heme chaperone HemW [Kineothrix sp. MSJ-39]